MCLLSILLSTWLVIMISNHLTHHQMSIYNLKLWMELTVNLVRVYHRCTFRPRSGGELTAKIRMLTDTGRNQQRIGNCWTQSLVTGNCIPWPPQISDFPLRFIHQAVCRCRTWCRIDNVRWMVWFLILFKKFVLHLDWWINQKDQYQRYFKIQMHGYQRDSNWNYILLFNYSVSLR